VLSAAIHILLLLALLLRPARREPTEAQPNASDIALVFASSAPKAATTPNPGNGASRPKATESAQAQGHSPPHPPPMLHPSARPPAPPVAKPTTPPAPPQAKPAVPVPQPSAPAPPPAKPHNWEPARLPPLPPLVVPTPFPVPEAPAYPEPTPPPAVRQAGKAEPARPASRQASLAKPLMRSWSLAGGSSILDPYALGSGSPDVRRGASHEALSSDLHGADQLGPDWSAELLAWVDEHKHYPEQAAANGEDGDASVEVTTDRSGKVQRVTLVGRSGSVFLDMGLESLFRYAHLPPFPYDAADNTVTFTFTMHYILIR